MQVAQQPKSTTTEQAYILTQFSTTNIDQKRVQAVNKLSFDLISQIQNQIVQDQFQVNQNQTQFKLKPKKTETNKNTSDHHYKNNCIEDEETDDKRNGGASQQNKYFKSELTKDDIDRIKQLKMMQRKHERDLQLKTRAYEQNLKKFNEEEKQLLEKQRKEKNEERVRQVAKKIQEIRQRQSERSQKLEEQKKKITEIKRQKTLYQKLEEDYKTVEIEEERKKQEIKNQIKLSKNIHFSDIRQHQKKYDDIIRQQRQNREKKLGELTKGSYKKFYQSRILRDLIDEDKKSKLEDEEKRNQIKQYLTKKQQYGEMVRNKFMPNVAAKDEQEVNQKKQIAARSLSVFDLQKKGNEYMRQVHENIHLKGSSVSKMEAKPEIFKYKNYLEDIKERKIMTSVGENRYIDQINNLMKKQNMTQEQKFYKAKLITQKIEESKRKNSDKMIESINAKIYLLKHISPND